MSKQVLDVYQMQHLQELGLDTSNASMCWIKTPNGRDLTFNDEWINLDKSILDPIPAYTLQDVLDVLPTSIRHNDCTYYLGMAKRGIAYELYSEHGMVQAIQFGRRTLIDAAYELFCWCVEWGFVETNKNE